MTVYVDDMYLYPMGEYRGMKMSHMMADTTEELLAMAHRCAVAKRHIQNAGTFAEHFDISKSKRDIAVANGAVQITMREMAAYQRRRRNEGPDSIEPASGRPASCEQGVVDQPADREGQGGRSDPAGHQPRAGEQQTFF